MSRQICHGCKGTKKWPDGSVCANCEGKGYLGSDQPTEAKLRKAPACEHCGGETLAIMEADARHAQPWLGCTKCDDPRDPRCKVPGCGLREGEHPTSKLLRCWAAINGLVDPFA